MPLTHVYEWIDGKGFIPTTAQEAAQKYCKGVSADSKIFLCRSCLENVCFVNSKPITPHFRHQKANSTNVSHICEDRSSNYSSAEGPLIKNIMVYDFPLYLYLNGKKSFSLGIGFCIPKFHTQCLNWDSITIRDRNDKRVGTISNKRLKGRHEYQFNIGNHISSVYNLLYLNSKGNQIGTNSLDGWKWPTQLDGIRDTGTIFRYSDGMMLKAGARVLPNINYLVLTRNPIDQKEVQKLKIHIKKIIQTECDGGKKWIIYKVRALKVTPQSARFFLNFRAFLTPKPIVMTPIWPPCNKASDYLRIQTKQIFVYVNDPNAKVCVYGGKYNDSLYRAGEINSYASSDNGSVFELISDPAVAQIVVQSGIVMDKFYFKRDVRTVFKKINRSSSLITVSDLNGSILDKNEYDEIPLFSKIQVNAQFDGRAVVRVSGKTIAVTRLKSKIATVLSDITPGMEIEFYQANDLIKKIVFKKPKAKAKSIIEEIEFDIPMALEKEKDHRLLARIKKCQGTLVTFTNQMALKLTRWSQYPMTRQWIWKHYARLGLIPKDALKIIEKEMAQMSFMRIDYE